MKRTFLAVLIIISLVLLPLRLSAQIGLTITEEDREEFARHRATLYQHMEENVAVFIGAYSRGDNLRWRQNNRFYYLSGVEIPFAALVMDGRDDHTILFLAQGREGRRALYDGETIGPGPTAVAEFGIEDVRSIEKLEETLKELLARSGKVLTPLRPEETVLGANDSAIGAQRAAAQFAWSKASSRENRIKDWLQQLAPEINIEDICPLVDEMRRVKTPWEIERMTEACRIAGLGHVAAWKATAPGVMEYQLEGIALGQFVANGALYPSYNAIVGAGKNNNVLHYSLSTAEAKDGDLVLMDFGPDYRYYSADITRTWPVNGKFSAEQKLAYNKCLEVQKKLIAAVKPGVTISQLSQLNRKLFTEMGLGQNALHGPSHYLGMAVHDVGSGRKPLEPGCVITVEPGIYFLDKGWGIRIEDVVVVTEDGCKVLSAMIPKEVAEIEQIMRDTEK